MSLLSLKNLSIFQVVVWGKNPNSATVNSFKIEKPVFQMSVHPMKYFQKSCISVKHKSSSLPYYYSCLTLVRYNVHYRIGAQQNTERKKEATVPLLFFWLDYSERLTRSSRALSYLCYLMQTGVTFCVLYRHKSTALTVKEFKYFICFLSLLMILTFMATFEFIPFVTLQALIRCFTLMFL